MELVELKDRFQIIFKPKPGLKIEELKKIWDEIVLNIPEIRRSENTITDNGLQGVEFRDTQDKIKEGKDTWLSNGLAFIDGKVVEMSYGDFKKRINVITL